MNKPEQPEETAGYSGIFDSIFGSGESAKDDNNCFSDSFFLSPTIAPPVGISTIDVKTDAEEKLKSATNSLSPSISGECPFTFKRPNSPAICLPKIKKIIKPGCVEIDSHTAQQPSASITPQEENSVTPPANKSMLAMLCDNDSEIDGILENNQSIKVNCGDVEAQQIKKTIPMPFEQANCEPVTLSLSQEFTTHCYDRLQDVLYQLSAAKSSGNFAYQVASSVDTLYNCCHASKQNELRGQVELEKQAMKKVESISNHFISKLNKMNQHNYHAIENRLSGLSTVLDEIKTDQIELSKFRNMLQMLSHGMDSEQ